MKVRRLIGFFTVIIFVLTTIVAFAAGNSYFVIKDGNGVCKVIKAQEKTSATTIAGPFKTKAEAQNAMGKECPKVSSKPSKSTTDPNESTAKRSKSTTYHKSCY
jgi:hypothetical protein